MAEENNLLIDQRGSVRMITFNRPDKLNAFNGELTFKLQDALKEAEKDPETRCIVLTGAGRGFCAGQDLQDRMMAMASTEAASRPSLADSIRRRYNPIITRIRRMEKPVIGAINGVAAGAGASVAFACDIRIASDTASFIQSFSKIGLVPDSGSTFFLPRLIGPTKALELMLTADKIDAQTALALGMVNKVVPFDKLMDETLKLAMQLSQGPTRAFGLTKRAFNRAVFPDLEELLDYEACMQEIAGRSDDFEEGVKAFMEKRPAVYSGK
jgi:2-(1,2-epoxy-1,2-dihydrophenyl)acetyl-CoA isomerase